MHFFRWPAHMSSSNQYTHVQVHIRTPLACACLEQQRALWMLGSDQVTGAGSSRVVAPCNSHKQHAKSPQLIMAEHHCPLHADIASGPLCSLPLPLVIRLQLVSRPLPAWLTCLSAGELASNVPDVPMVSMDASGTAPGSSPAAAAAGAEGARALRGELFAGHGAFEWLCATFTAIRTVQVPWI